MNASDIAPVEVPREPPPPDPTAERCHLLGPTALIVQALMGVFVIGSLVVKRHLEKRKRPWRVWTMDVAKQLVGQGVIHMLNILISFVIADADAANPNNPCSVYFLNILIDTTIGVGILYLALKGFTTLFIRRFGAEAFVTGYYGRPPQMSYWLRQLQPYLLAVVAMKLVVLLPLTLPGISGWLIRAGQTVLSALPIDVQVVFVLSVFPLIMNVLQFCLIDQLIKAGKHVTEAEEGMDMGESYHPLPTSARDVEFGLGLGLEPGDSGSPKPRSRTGSVMFDADEDEGPSDPRTGLKTKAPSIAGSFWSRRTGDTDPEEIAPEHFELGRHSTESDRSR